MSELDLFLKNISQKVVLDPENLDKLVAAFRRVTVRKKQFLIQPGFIARHRTYVLEGAFRSYVIDEKGEDRTIQLAVEDWWITDYNSYVYQKPATQFVEALEDSIILQIDYHAEQELKAFSHQLETLFRIMAERTAAYLARRIVSNLTQSAEERYHEFSETYPKMVYRLPQYALASYLNMTREFLSKIRNDKVKKR